MSREEAKNVFVRTDRRTVNSMGGTAIAYQLRENQSPTTYQPRKGRDNARTNFLTLVACSLYNLLATNNK